MKRFVWASYGMYFIGGMTGVIFGAVLPELLAHYHVTYAVGGFIVFLQAIGFMAGVPLVSYLMNHVHYKYVLTASALAVAIAQLTILTLPNIEWVYVLVILNGFGASALETAVASYVMETFVGQRAVFMSRLEVSFGLGALFLPAVASGLIALHIWRFSFLVIGGFALILAILWQTISVSLDGDQAGEQLDAVTSPPPTFQNRRTRYVMLALFLFMIFIYVGIEGGLNSFLPSVFDTSLKALPYYASLSSTVFWIAMVIGRIAIGWIARRVNYERYLLWSMLATCAFLATLAGLRVLSVSFIVVFGLGLGMSAIYSITMVYANHTFPGMERTVTSSVTLCAGVGGAVFPALIGYAMDHVAPTHILWLFVALALALLVTLVSVNESLRRLRLKPGEEVTVSVL